MKMNKMFTGLIALVAGVALSAGSAFATAGYVGGDPAMMKLVPYFETGDAKRPLSVSRTCPRKRHLRWLCMLLLLRLRLHWMLKTADPRAWMTTLLMRRWPLRTLGG